MWRDHETCDEEVAGEEIETINSGWVLELAKGVCGARRNRRWKAERQGVERAGGCG